MIRIGDQIPIQIQLFDGATGKFPRAVVQDAASATISGSPFSLTHVALGQYSNAAAVMPSTAFVTVQIAVYNDAGFTTLSADHEITLDQFDLDESSLAATALDNTVWTNAKAAFIDAAISTVSGNVWEELTSAHNTAGTFGANAQTPAINPTQVANAVWNALTSSHTVPGSFGLNAQTPSLNPAQVAGAVWDALTSAYNVSGSFGEFVQNISGGGGGGGGSACGLIVVLESASLEASLDSSELQLGLESSELNTTLDSETLTVQFNCGP